jgi:hypothetical protein
MAAPEIKDEALKKDVRNNLLVSGGSIASMLMNEPVNDYDVYLPKSEDPLFISNVVNALCKLGLDSNSGVEVLTSSKNAYTIRWNGKHIIQICFYTKPSLLELVSSFDYSYCQVGVAYNPGKYDGFRVVDVAYTEHYARFVATGITEYVGSEYPLSSLIRLVKTAEKGYFAKRSYIRSFIKILNDIYSRGFNGYGDFKDQLNAIDLLLLSNEYDKTDLMGLFNKLNRGEAGTKIPLKELTEEEKEKLSVLIEQLELDSDV